MWIRIVRLEAPHVRDAARQFVASLERLRRRVPAHAPISRTFNPEAAAFWVRHCAPVCDSVMRAPEAPFG